jgi:hypothetical protein
VLDVFVEPASEPVVLVVLGPPEASALPPWLDPDPLPVVDPDPLPVLEPDPLLDCVPWPDPLWLAWLAWSADPGWPVFCDAVCPAEEAPLPPPELLGLALVFPLQPSVNAPASSIIMTNLFIVLLLFAI